MIGGHGGLTLGLELLGHHSLGDLGEQVLLVGLQVLLELGVPLDDPLDGDLVQHSLDTGHDEGNLDLCIGGTRGKGRDVSDYSLASHSLITLQTHRWRWESIDAASTTR